ncbi:MAG: ATP-binding protein [Armatimonadota bacterium]
MGKRMPWEITFQFQADPAVFRVIRKSITSALRSEGLPESEIVLVEIAVGEVLSNAYVHAYDQERGPMQIDLEYDGNQFVFMIHDHGKPLTAIPTIPDALPARAGKGGRGLYLVGQLMDEAQVIHPGPRGGGTAIRMVKRLSG